MTDIRSLTKHFQNRQETLSVVRNLSAELDFYHVGSETNRVFANEENFFGCEVLLDRAFKT